MNLNSISSISKSIANLFGRHSLISMTFFPYPFFFFFLVPFPPFLLACCLLLGSEAVAEDFHWYFIYSLINATILSEWAREKKNESKFIMCFLQFAPFCFLFTHFFVSIEEAHGYRRKLPIRYSFALCVVWNLSRSGRYRGTFILFCCWSIIWWNFSSWLLIQKLILIFFYFNKLN